MKKIILVTPQSFNDYSQIIKDKYKKDYIFRFVKGPINNQKKLNNYFKDVYGCIIGSEKIDEAILKNHKNLKIICRFGTNTENIDKVFCEKNSIMLKKLNKQINSEPVARHSLALVLAITNNLDYYKEIAKKNIWNRKKNLSPLNTKVGIIGMGNIGKIFSKYLKGLKFNINYFSRNDKKINYASYYSSLEKLINDSDILSIHLPSNENTKKLFSKKIIKSLKGKILINTSRGDLIDEVLLYNLLKKKYIKFAALDVFFHEPTIYYSKKIRLLPNVISTCHSSFYDDITIKKMVTESLKKIIK